VNDPEPARQQLAVRVCFVDGDLHQQRVLLGRVDLGLEIPSADLGLPDVVAGLPASAVGLLNRLEGEVVARLGQQASHTFEA